MKYEEGHIPASLRTWLDAHADRIYAVSHGDGYATDSGKAYDILLAPGWRMGDDWCHTLIEPTVAAMLAQLKAIVPCDCPDCQRCKTSQNNT